jgi:hypothetical protein
MTDKPFTLKDSGRFWLLNEKVPDLNFMDPQYVKSVNQRFRLPFTYTGIVLLSPQGQFYAMNLREAGGRCLGGGVLASRDLEWLGSGKNGPKPGDYVPPKGIFGSSKEPQSALPSEWIALEFGLVLCPPFGNPYVCKWDQVNAIAKVRKQGRDIHIRIDGVWGEPGVSIFGQANAQNMETLLTISALTGVPTYY